MFEQSLVESSGRVRTRSRRYAVPSFLLETALVTTLILLPYLYPAALPRTSLTTPLIAPPPPPAAPTQPQLTSAMPAARPRMLNINAPSHIPTTIPRSLDTPAEPVPGTAFLGSGVPGMSMAPLFPSTPPPAPPARVAKPGPLRVSAGIAQGQLIVPILPRYPAIAQQAHIQGTVVVSALIGTDGRIASLRVLSGPPLLVPAATQAIQRARYRPWTLNGQPVEVETTINVIFSLGGE